MRETGDNGSPFASRRTFVVAAVMAGWCSPARLVEAVTRELADKSTAELRGASSTCDGGPGTSATYPPARREVKA